MRSISSDTKIAKSLPRCARYFNDFVFLSRSLRLHLGDGRLFATIAMSAPILMLRQKNSTRFQWRRAVTVMAYRRTSNIDAELGVNDNFIRMVGETVWLNFIGIGNDGIAVGEFIWIEMNKHLPIFHWIALGECVTLGDNILILLYFFFQFSPRYRSSQWNQLQLKPVVPGTDYSCFRQHMIKCGPCGGMQMHGTNPFSFVCPKYTCFSLVYTLTAWISPEHPYSNKSQL